MADDSGVQQKTASQIIQIQSIGGIRQPSDGDLQHARKRPLRRLKSSSSDGLEERDRRGGKKNNLVTVCYPASVSGCKPGTR